MDETCILLATYQGEPFLKEQLDSLLRQSDASWRLLWRDDGSTDSTRAILEDFVARAGATRVQSSGRRDQRLGALGSFMALLAEAPADAARFAFCDQDDVWLPGKLARAATAFAAVPADRPALYCSRQHLVDTALRPVGLSPLPVRQPAFGNALVQNIATGCTVVLNAAARRVVLAAPPPPRSSMHDWWCYLVITGIGGRVIFDPEPQILYRQHSGNAVGAAAGVATRARRALRRGASAFLRTMAAHLDVLANFDALTPVSRKMITTLCAMRDAGPWRRLQLLRRAGVYRQGFLENALLHLWIAQQPLPVARSSPSIPVLPDELFGSNRA